MLRRGIPILDLDKEQFNAVFSPSISVSTLSLASSVLCLYHNNRASPVPKSSKLTSVDEHTDFIALLVDSAGCVYGFLSNHPSMLCEPS